MTSRPNWPLFALTCVLGATLLLASVVAWYAFAIARPDAERADTARRLQAIYFDVLTRRIERIETKLNLR